MRIFSVESNSAIGARANRKQAMTLVETVITATVFTFVILAITSANLFGMKQDELVQSKLGASDQSRRGFNLLSEDIRSAKGWKVGNISGTNNFAAIGSGTNLQGTAIQLTTTSDTNKFIRYYFDTSDSANSNGKLLRFDSTTSISRVIASNLITSLYFTVEDYRGVIQTVRSYKSVIHVTLQFCQFQYPLTLVGTNQYYDSYRQDFKLTPHLPDGP